MAHLHLLHDWALLLVRVRHVTLLWRLERPRAAKLAGAQLLLRLRQAAHEGQLRRRCTGRCNLRCYLHETGQQVLCCAALEWTQKTCDSSSGGSSI
jgi:hypothetical protein